MNRQMRTLTLKGCALLVAIIGMSACTSPEQRLDNLGAQTEKLLADVLTGVTGAKDPQDLTKAFEDFTERAVDIACEQGKLLEDNPELRGAAERQEQKLESSMFDMIQSMSQKMEELSKTQSMDALNNLQATLAAQQESMTRAVEKCAQGL
jgi:hypothetical protein